MGNKCRFRCRVSVCSGAESTRSLRRIPQALRRSCGSLRDARSRVRDSPGLERCRADHDAQSSLETRKAQQRQPHRTPSHERRPGRELSRSYRRSTTNQRLELPLERLTFVRALVLDLPVRTLADRVGTVRVLRGSDVALPNGVYWFEGINEPMLLQGPQDGDFEFAQTRMVERVRFLRGLEYSQTRA